MENYKFILSTAQEKYQKAFSELNIFLSSRMNMSQFEKTDFNVARGLFYSFFDSHSILVSTLPYYFKSETKCRWQYVINIDGIEISEGYLPNRETAEYVAFMRAFQFLDTKLFIEYTKGRFSDESETSCLNINWEHLHRVLNHKRINLV